MIQVLSYVVTTLIRVMTVDWPINVDTFVMNVVLNDPKAIAIDLKLTLVTIRSI